MNKFEAGKAYSTRSACDWDCIFKFECIKRTAKTVTFIYHDEPLTCRIKLDGDGNEYVKPLGSYSMAPYLYA